LADRHQVAGLTLKEFRDRDARSFAAGVIVERRRRVEARDLDPLRRSLRRGGGRQSNQRRGRKQQGDPPRGISHAQHFDGSGAAPAQPVDGAGALVG
jgi:hypothetical protein